jgi:hypothetical protein
MNNDYKIIYHGADSEGRGHFFVELVDENGNSSFYGFHPSGNFFKSEKEVRTDDNINYLGNIGIGDHIYKEQTISKEQYNTVINIINSEMLNISDYYLPKNNCIDFCQKVYESTGEEGTFTQLFSRDELLTIDKIGTDNVNLGGGEYALYKYGASDYETSGSIFEEFLKDSFQGANPALYNLLDFQESMTTTPLGSIADWLSDLSSMSKGIMTSWKDIWDSVIGGFSYRDFIQTTARLIVNSDESVNAVEALENLASIFSNTRLENIAIEMNKYNNLDFTYKTGTLNDGKECIYVNNSSGMLVRNGETDETYIFIIPEKGSYKHIILDDGIGELVVSYSDGYEGNIKPYDYRQGSSEYIYGSLLNDVIIGNN